MIGKRIQNALITLLGPVVLLADVRSVGVQGYASGPIEDLSKFSPLTDWPK